MGGPSTTTVKNKDKPARSETEELELRLLKETDPVERDRIRRQLERIGRGRETR